MTYDAPHADDPRLEVFTPDVVAGATYPGETMPDGRAVMFVTRGTSRALGDQWMTVRDRATGTDWEVRRADCGAPCRCAAEARPPAPPTATTGD